MVWRNRILGRNPWVPTYPTTSTSRNKRLVPNPENILKLCFCRRDRRGENEDSCHCATLNGAVFGILGKMSAVAHEPGHKTRNHPVRWWNSACSFGRFGFRCSYNLCVIAAFAINNFRPVRGVGGLEFVGAGNVAVKVGGVISVSPDFFHAATSAFAVPQAPGVAQLKTLRPSAREAVLRNREPHFSIQSEFKLRHLESGRA